MIINKILVICITIILIMSSIFMGGPLKSNIEIINAIISTIAVLYIMRKSKKERRKIITNKIDIFVIVFMLSSCVPLLFGTYISLNDTILSIYQSISITAIYFLVKQLKVETNNKYNFIEFAILISSLIVFIIGIDNLTKNVFVKWLHPIGIPYYVNTQGRMIANLGYANSTAIIFAISSFIAIGLAVNNEKELPKTFYGLLTFCYIAGIGITKSKATILSFVLVLIIYILLLKDKKKKIETLFNIVITVISAILYVVFFEKIKTTENYLGIWLLIPLLGIVNGLFWIINNKISKYFEKVSKKQIIIVIISLILVVIIGYAYGLKQTKKVVLFTSETGETEFVHFIYNIEGNKEYCLTFDINSNTPKEKGHKIVIEELNIYNKKVCEHIEEFDNFEGKKEFKFITNDDTVKFKIRVMREEKVSNSRLEINSFTFNDKETALKYKYLPTSLVNIVKGINIENKSFWERGIFILDGIKLAKDNFLFGAGGNAWNYLYGTVQSYDYVASQSHCFYTQVVIENGILGAIGILGILICVVIYSIKYLRKNKNEKYTIILCALRSFTGSFCS